MLSARLKRATTRRYFRTEIKNTKFGRRDWASLLFLVVYLFNLSVLLGGMTYVSVKQANGDFQCKSITVKFSEDVWEDAIVKLPNNEYEEKTLIYSYFSGVYVQDGTRHDGRPVYIERRKFDGTKFDTTSPYPNASWDPLGLGPSTGFKMDLRIKTPAKIQYCKSIKSWVFMHENIRKSRRQNSDCPWLLRSETTDAYDIEEIQGSWQVWQGVIATSDVRISCNECSNDDDCNLNGVCRENGSCECFDDVEGKTFLGPHCEGILKDHCHTVTGGELF